MTVSTLNMDMRRKKIGHFYIVEHIGAGGMSHVYLAVNPRSREKRAVKILAKQATASPSTYARFMREVEIIRSLDHPHIVKILNSGAIEQCYFYMMELMPGGSLARRLERGRVPLTEAVRFFTAICDGMAHAHERGIIHRDLKPANILIDASGSPRVSDFGIAKSLEGNQLPLTHSSEIMGTIAYLAPEQRFNTKRVDRRADVFALGAILYEMIMGFPPLGKFPWPRELQPSFPEKLQAVLEKCLAINPAERFSHAGLLHSEVEKYYAVSGIQEIETHQPTSHKIEEREKIQDYLSGSDRIEEWLKILRSGTTRERLAVIREMVERMEVQEAKAILKLFSAEGDRARWGLIRVLGDLKIKAATPLILNELKNPFHRECAIEALGKIGADEAFRPIREFMIQNPESAMIALWPLARTGKQKAIEYLRQYLSHDMAIVRQAAVRALTAVEAPESLEILVEHLSREKDDRVHLAVQQAIFCLESVNSREKLYAGGQTCATDL